MESENKNKVSVSLNVGGLLQVILIVLAILVNFTNVLEKSKFPVWLWNALEGWSAIPFVIFFPWLISVGIVIAIVAICLVIAALCS